MSEDKKQVSPEDEKTQDAAAIPDQQLSDVAGGGYGIGGKTVKEDVKLRDDVEVKRSGWALGN